MGTRCCELSAPRFDKRRARAKKFPVLYNNCPEAVRLASVGLAQSHGISIQTGKEITVSHEDVEGLVID